MDRVELRRILSEGPIIASVQADAGTPLDDPKILLASAQASLQQGVKLLRLQGTENIRTIKQATNAPVIGLIKRVYSGSDVYITPTRTEVEELISLNCEIIAIDATGRDRPRDEQVSSLLEIIRLAGRLAMADCDSLESIVAATELGFDIVSTTLSGYTANSGSGKLPDLNLLRQARAATGAILLAEGRFSEEWHSRAALQVGADGVVIGGAINDPIKQTRRFVGSAKKVQSNVVGIDLGGTWLRGGLFSPDMRLLESSKISAPQTHQERLDFIEEFAGKHNVQHVGISAGGTIDYRTNTVIEAKGFISDYVQQSFNIKGLNITAINDGLATAWGHACHPQFAGLKVATLALGTGIGCGVAGQNRIITDSNGNYPRINDAYLVTGGTIEETLGGLYLDGPLEELEADELTTVLLSAQTAIDVVNHQFPDVIVICGGVGLSDWFTGQIDRLYSLCPIALSPYGDKAGLYGAAALQIYPPEGFE